MDVRIPEYMIAIAEDASLAKAAERLHISSSALSQTLSRLEAELGTPLFHRSGGRWTPTEKGEVYLRGARELVMLKEDAYSRIRKLARRQKKDVRMVICSQAYMLYRDTLLPALRRELPEVRLELHRADSRQAAEYLLSDVADIAVLCARGQDNSLLDYRLLYEETLSLAVPGDLAWPGEAVDVEKVMALPFVLPTENTFLGEEVSAALSKAGIAVNGVYRSETVEGIARLVEHGYGMALLPARIAAAINCRAYSWPEAPVYRVACATACYAEKKRDIPKVLDVICACAGGSD